MRFQILAVFSLLLALSFVSAHDEGQGNQNLNVLLSNATQINAQLENAPVELPAAAQKIISEGNFTAIITRLNGTVDSFYLTIHEKKVTHFVVGEPAKSSYDIITDEETINNIASSEAVPDALLSYYDQGKIKIKAHGFGNNVKLFFAKIFLHFAKK